MTGTLQLLSKSILHSGGKEKQPLRKITLVLTTQFAACVSSCHTTSHINPTRTGHNISTLQFRDGLIPSSKFLNNFLDVDGKGWVQPLPFWSLDEALLVNQEVLEKDGQERVQESQRRRTRTIGHSTSAPRTSDRRSLTRESGMSGTT